MTVVVRDLTAADLDAVVAYEDVLFPEPWSRRLYQLELELRALRRYRAAEVDDHFAGWAGVMLGEEAHLLTLGTVPEHQRTGVARALLADQLAYLARSGTQKVILEVGVTNVAAQALYRSFGFAPVGVRKGYYQRTGEDALVLVVDHLERFVEVPS